MIKYINALFALLLLCVACTKPEKETPNGLKYTVLKAGDGAVPKKDQIIVFNYELKDSKDSVWSNTFKEGISAASMVGDSSQIATEDGMTQMFRMLSNGDSVKVSLKVADFFKNFVKAPVPPQIDSTLSVVYTIKVHGIMALEEYNKLREQQMAKRVERTATNDSETINTYLTENKLTSKQDTSGLQYIIYNNTGNAKPTIDDCVEVKYTGRILKTGKIFDKSEKISFPLNGVIAGWKIGIPLLGVGDSATLYIPSGLAYGPQGYPGAIPPDAILIFNVTLLDVKKTFDETTRSCK